MSKVEKNYKYLTVRYILDAREIQAIEELLTHYQNYEDEGGSRPFAEWTIEKMFQAVMELGAKRVISEKIQEMQFRQGLIDYKEMLKDGFKTMEERRNDGTGRDDH